MYDGWALHCNMESTAWLMDGDEEWKICLGDFDGKVAGVGAGHGTHALLA